VLNKLVNLIGDVVCWCLHVSELIIRLLYGKVDKLKPMLSVCKG